ncbi:hypothetical protein G5714_022290 [Onychostoma macrolepis]|uniref:Uncharacterized protein n=1 Tax=Onychostoma macrolepis TaxID=369639 RepID=A0A7J6BNQ9_9TELE|nr:hypothetical protein G5714_022290 [Onychostoma macrolepis]
MEAAIRQNKLAGTTSHHRSPPQECYLPQPGSIRSEWAGQGFLSAILPLRNRDRETGISRQPQPTTGDIPSSVAASSTRLHTVGVGGAGIPLGDPPSRTARNRDRETGLPSDGNEKGQRIQEL